MDKCASNPNHKSHHIKSEHITSPVGSLDQTGGATRRSQNGAFAPAGRAGALLVLLELHGLIAGRRGPQAAARMLRGLRAKQRCVEPNSEQIGRVML